MAEKNLSDLLSEYESISANKDVPEAGASHYLKRGALQGISALADLVPNLYNLGKAAVGTVATAAGRPDLAPEVGNANPIARFLQESYGVGGPVRASPSIGGELGGAAIEGMAGAVGQGPMGLVKAAPQAMAIELAKQTAKNATLGSLAGGGGEVGREATGGSQVGGLIGSILAGVVAPATFLRNGGVTVGAIRSGMKTVEDMKAAGTSGLADAASAKIEPAFSDFVGGTIKGAVSGTPNAAENLT